MSTAARRVPETIQATGLSGRYCDLHGFRSETRDAPVCLHFKPENHRSGNFRVARMTCRDFRWDTFLPRGLPVYFVRVPQVAPWRLQTRPAPYIRLIHVIFRRNSTTIFGSCRRRQRECRNRYRPPAFRTVFEVFWFPVASPITSPPTPLFCPHKPRRPGCLRADGVPSSYACPSSAGHRSNQGPNPPNDGGCWLNTPNSRLSVPGTPSM